MDVPHIHQLFLNSNGICTDTRNIKKNQIFVALKGENFNGNTYALQAIKNGASYAIIDDPTIKHSNTLLVDDCLTALQRLATFHRNYLNIPIIALTGSNGKTTTKELINAVLSTTYNCVATKGNLNNHIGVPLTLLSMSKDTEIGVVEMGANHMREIAALCEIAAPNYGYITNIGKAHLEGFGSEENILIGKTELYDYIIKNNGVLFCNADDQKLFPLAKASKKHFFSKHNKKHLVVSLKSSHPFIKLDFKNTEINSQLIGEYNYTNIAASILIGKELKVSSENIKKGIENYLPTNNRSELVQKGTNTIILDAYNANPSSMKEALNHLDRVTTDKKHKIAILGDMFEMGKYALKEHQHLIELATKIKLETLLLVGENFYSCKNNYPNTHVFRDLNSLVSHLKETEYTNSLLLIKGSRGMKLEQTLDFFE